MNIASAKPCLDENDRDAMNKVFDSCLIAEGEEVALFESELSRAIGVSHSVAVSSGFAALHLALKAMSIGEGDEVIVPCVSTCPAMRNAVWAAGGIPVYADVNPDDFNLSISGLQEVMTPRVRAIIAPHHMGVPANILDMNKLGVPVLEDCAQAIGASWDGRPVGSLGMVSVFSFYATKIITSIDGGAVCTSDPSLADRVRELRYYRKKTDNRMRLNYKMQNIHAALGRSQLLKLSQFLQRRKSIAEQCIQALGSVNSRTIISIHRTNECVYYKLALLLPPKARDALALRLEQGGLPSCSDFQWMTEERNAFYNACTLMPKELTIPVYPALTDHEVERLLLLLREAAKVL